ncbi:inter-alpha-trypsin inhibitor heavy chain H3-like isoform X1 [Clupea harengus]|uniref:Inter-alpha-trypsin inhibitor heavy chain H3-like isoform X1 n=1 Tax=Clupea harengus TaxID=7950 RepID=A0A6P8FKQ4_CLUHA|nr:inter-alpha-trypsin inhibitor heavy chain H3-like isoform X1 [Clupea harengus]
MDRATAILIIVASLLQTTAGQKRSNWDIYSFHINTTVTSRYAITVITSRVVNRHDNSTEIDFYVKIPKTAFISKFRMTIDGEMYDGVVKQKEEAKRQYSHAVSQRQNAALVTAVGRTLEDFKTSVTVAAHSKVTFELTYEELLQRRLGKYELLINAQPGQPVKDFKIDVSIYEKPGVNVLGVEGSLASKDLANAITKTSADKQAWVNFYPTKDQQMKCDGCGENGLSGDLRIIYDVERPHSKGEIMESGGFFVHYFAPTDLSRIPKNVVFIIDQSGSMYGKKMEQTRTALLKILEDLAEDDHFGLICFDDKISPWKRELLRATQRNLEKAKAFVRTIKDGGSTDINAAVLESVKMIKKYHKEGSASMLILLTDGDPTSGVTDLGRIQSNVREAIGKKFPLYCLGFGLDVNFEFLQKMAQENSGVGRRIYEDSDAALQLKGFYEEVAIPLLTSVQMNYTGATNLTQTIFSYYYNGSEIVVAGQITDNNTNDFSTEVIAISKNSKVIYKDMKLTKDEKLPADLSSLENFLQRLWACLTVKQLLEKELMLTGEEKEAVRKMALDLSLKYSFVTPLTSMVVTKPEGEDTQVANKPKEGEKPPITSRGGDDDDYGFRSSSYSDGDIQRFSVTSLKKRILASPARNPIQIAQDMYRGDSGTGGAGGDIQRFSVMYDLPAPLTPYRSSIDFDYDDVPDSTHHLSLATAVSATLTPGTPVRFLMTAEGQSLPLCFDIPAGHSVRLLQDPTSGLSMNGELKSSEGFKRIIIHAEANQHIQCDLNNITFTDGQSSVSFLWTQTSTSHKTDSMALTLRDHEIEVSTESVNVIILLHQKDGDSFLWPAVKQRPTNAALMGIMGKQYVTYEEDQSTSKLRIQDEEVDASKNSAKDLSIKTAPVVSCWLVELKFALQGELSDYTVSEL